MPKFIYKGKHYGELDDGDDSLSLSTAGLVDGNSEGGLNDKTHHDGETETPEQKSPSAATSTSPDKARTSRQKSRTSSSPSCRHRRRCRPSSSRRNRETSHNEFAQLDLSSANGQEIVIGWVRNTIGPARGGTIDAGVDSTSSVPVSQTASQQDTETASIASKTAKHRKDRDRPPTCRSRSSRTSLEREQSAAGTPTKSPSQRRPSSRRHQQIPKLTVKTEGLNIPGETEIEWYRNSNTKKKVEGVSGSSISTSSVLRNNTETSRTTSKSPPLTSTDVKKTKGIGILLDQRPPQVPRRPPRLPKTRKASSSTTASAATTTNEATATFYWQREGPSQSYVSQRLIKRNIEDVAKRIENCNKREENTREAVATIRGRSLPKQRVRNVTASPRRSTTKKAVVKTQASSTIEEKRPCCRSKTGGRRRSVSGDGLRSDETHSRNRSLSRSRNRGDVREKKPQKTNSTAPKACNESSIDRTRRPPTKSSSFDSLSRTTRPTRPRSLQPRNGGPSPQTHPNAAS